MLSGSELFGDPERETDPAALELRAVILATPDRNPVTLSRHAAGHLADYCDVALFAAMDDGTSAERAAYRRTLGRLAERGVHPI